MALSNDELYSEVQRRLIMSGEWDSILDLLQTKTSDSGLNDDLRHRAKERAGTGDVPTLRHIVQMIQEDASSSLSAAIRQQVIEVIKAAVSEVIEP